VKLSDKQKGIIALIGLAAVYAFMGIFARYLSLSFKFFQQIYLRIFFASLIALLFLKNNLWSKLKKISLKEWGLIIFRGISYYLLGVAMFTQAVLLTKISTVSFISSIPMTAMLGFLIIKEKLTLPKFLYIALAFVGVTIISVKNMSSFFSWGYGEILAFLSCFFCSLAIVLRKFQTKLLNNNEITQLMLIIAFLSLIITSFFVGEGIPTTNWNLSILFIVIIAGLFNTLNIWLTNYGFEKVQTSLAANILTLEMLFAVIFGFLFYREVPGIKDVVGGILILFSVIKMNQLE